MESEKTVWIVLTTYNRLAYAKRTLIGVLNNLVHTNMNFFIADDGSDSEGYTDALVDTIREHPRGSSQVVTYDGARRGVGHMCNMAINHIKAAGDDLYVILEDDWELREPFDVASNIALFDEVPNIGMVRWGYMSVGIEASLMSAAGHLWWNINPNGYQYRYTGHPSIRNMHFHAEYGMFDEGLSPGQNELSMCAKVNAKPHGPRILVPVVAGELGLFAHIGAESLADTPPGV